MRDLGIFLRAKVSPETRSSTRWTRPNCETRVWGFRGCQASDEFGNRKADLAGVKVVSVGIQLEVFLEGEMSELNAVLKLDERDEIQEVILLMTPSSATACD